MVTQCIIIKNPVRKGDLDENISNKFWFLLEIIVNFQQVLLVEYLKSLICENC